jgi:hypothetical protein
VTRNVLLFALFAILISACGDDTPQVGPPVGQVPAPMPGPGSIPPIPTPTPVPVPAPPAAGGAACLAGNWRANEFVAMVRRSAKRALRGEGQLTRASGTIDLVFAPADPTGRGTFTARGNDLVHRATVTEQGITVNVTVTITGESTNPYTVLPGDIIRVEDSIAGGTLRARANAQATGGLRFSRSDTDSIDFEGTYAFECTPAQLQVWELGPNAQRRGQPVVVLDRMP